MQGAVPDLVIVTNRPGKYDRLPRAVWLDRHAGANRVSGLLARASDWHGLRFQAWLNRAVDGAIHLPRQEIDLDPQGLAKRSHSGTS